MHQTDIVNERDVSNGQESPAKKRKIESTASDVSRSQAWDEYFNQGNGDDDISGDELSNEEEEYDAVRSRFTSSSSSL